MAITDNEAPLITEMFVNDATTFTNGALVGPDAMLYINVTDNEGISMEHESASKGMKLQLDGAQAQTITIA